MSKGKELSQLANKVEYDDGTDKIRIDAVQVPQSIFKTIAVAGQSNVEADTTSDTLTLVAGTNMTLTTDAGTDTITLASSGSGGTQNLFSTVAVAGQNSIVADSTTDTLTLAAGSNITLTTDQATDTLTITSTAGSGTLSNIVEDTSPQLGGNLESNTFEIQMADNNKIALGTGERGYLRHTGASGKVQLFSTVGGIDIRTTANDETIAISSDDGSGGIANYIIADGSTGQTELYYYGSKKFQTENTGARVEGDLTVSNNLTVTGDILSVVDIDSIKNIKFEGATDNTNEITLTSADPSTDRTITLPDASGTVCVSASGNLVLDANGNMTTLATVYTNSDVDVHLNTSTATSGQILSWTGTDYDWVADQTGGGGGGTPGGSNTEVQFNNAGAFAGDSDFTYNSTTNVLTVGSIVSNAAGTPTITSNSAVNISVGSSVIIQQNSGGGGFRVGNMTTAERNALTAANGEIVYNTSDNQFEVYQNGAWVTMVSSAGGQGITVQDEGGALSTAGTTLNFVGAGVTASGTGATKTITISGNAGSTFTTDVEVTSSGTSGSANLMLNNTDTANNFGKAIEAFRSGITTGKRHQILLGKDSSNNDTATISYYYDGSASTSNRLEFGFWGADALLNVVADGDVGIGVTNPTAKLDVDGNIAYKPDGTNVSSVKAGARNVFNITAPNAPNHYTFNDPDSIWFPTAEDDPTLYLRRGETYYFVVNASGHPFEIRNQSGGTAWTEGITNNTTAVGTIIFKVPMSISDTALAYQCTSHGNMEGSISIS